MQIEKLLFFLAALILSQLSFAETIFYKPSLKIAEVNCEREMLILNNTFRSQLKIRPPANERYSTFCRRLSRFAANSQDGNSAGKSITLLTTATKILGDFIVDQDVVGILDIDNIISAMSVVDHDLVQVRLCNTLNTGMRSQPKVCLYQSRNGLYFLEVTSPQSGRFAKTTIIKQNESSLSLESKNSQGALEMTFSGNWSHDKKSIDGKIGFSNGELPIVLKSDY